MTFLPRHLSQPFESPHPETPGGGAAHFSTPDASAVGRGAVARPSYRGTSQRMSTGAGKVQPDVTGRRDGHFRNCLKCSKPTALARLSSDGECPACVDPVALANREALRLAILRAAWKCDSRQEGRTE